MNNIYFYLIHKIEIIKNTHPNLYLFWKCYFIEKQKKNNYNIQEIKDDILYTNTFLNNIFNYKIKDFNKEQIILLNLLIINS